MKRTAAERNNVAYATRCRRRILQVQRFVNKLYQLRRMWIRVRRYKNAGVAGYAEAFIPVQSDSQASEWYSYFENDVLSSKAAFAAECEEL